jgi:phage internal scaffolding protein
MRDLYIPRERVYAPHSDELITKQSMKAECDIHNILSQYKQTGIIKHIQQYQPRYEDLPDAIDFQQSMNTIIQAEEAFSTLPATVRDRFGNDPQTFLEALSDASQTEELRRLGILKPAPVPRPADPQAPASPTGSDSPSAA